MAFESDILIVSEFRTGPAGKLIVDELQAAGYHVSHPPSAPGKNSVMIASRARITEARPLTGSFSEQYHLWWVKTGALSVVGVYMPGFAAKVPYWESIIHTAAQSEAPDLFIGDFNTGANDLDKDPAGTPYVAPEFMDRIAATGFVDLWRARHPQEREYTWFSRKGRNGFRLDHVFGTAAIDGRVANCRYDHGPRVTGVSDHSALVLEVQK